MFIRLKTDKYDHHDSQTLNVRASHMNKFTRLKTNEYSHHDDHTFKARVSHLIKKSYD